MVTGKSAWAALLAAGLMVGTSLPARAQDSTVPEIRLRQLEAQVRELTRQQGAVRPSPGSVAPQNGAVATPATAGGAPATSPMTDMLTRMDALETQVARLTAQNEELSNRLRQQQGGGGATPAAGATPTAAPNPLTPLPPPSATTTNLSVMTAPATVKPLAPAKPSSQRVAAVKAVVKPQTSDAADDEYSYGFRLYQAGFFPEAAQQLKFYLDKYPKHMRTSQARNLVGRSLLEDGKPRDAAPWFLQNYKLDPHGARAADSLLNLADAMRQIGDTSRACIAINEFATNYASEAKGRLRGQYETVKGGVSCN